VWIDLEASRRGHQARLAGKLKEEPQIPNEHRSPRGMAATHQKAHLLRNGFPASDNCVSTGTVAGASAVIQLPS